MLLIERLVQVSTVQLTRGSDTSKTLLGFDNKMKLRPNFKPWYKGKIISKIRQIDAKGLADTTSISMIDDA